MSDPTQTPQGADDQPANPKDEEEEVSGPVEVSYQTSPETRDPGPQNGAAAATPAAATVNPPKASFPPTGIRGPGRSPSAPPQPPSESSRFCQYQAVAWKYGKIGVGILTVAAILWGVSKLIGSRESVTNIAQPPHDDNQIAHEENVLERFVKDAKSLTSSGNVYVEVEKDGQRYRFGVSRTDSQKSPVSKDELDAQKHLTLTEIGEGIRAGSRQAIGNPEFLMELDDRLKSEVRGRLDDHDSRLSSVEKDVGEMKSDISNVKKDAGEIKQVSERMMKMLGTSALFPQSATP